jgi:hypothetical protein
MNKVKISFFKSDKGNSIPNQVKIWTDEGIYFQSYDSVIVFHPYLATEKVILDVNKWDYSKTTGKYRNEFLGETKEQTQKKIDDGTYLLKDLN